MKKRDKRNYQKKVLPAKLGFEKGNIPSLYLYSFFFLEARVECNVPVNEQNSDVFFSARAEKRPGVNCVKSIGWRILFSLDTNHYLWVRLHYITAISSFAVSELNSFIVSAYIILSKVALPGILPLCHHDNSRSFFRKHSYCIEARSKARGVPVHRTYACGEFSVDKGGNVPAGNSVHGNGKVAIDR